MDLEAPLYVLKPDKTRILVPNTIKLAILCIVFYLGVLLNVSLLKISIPNYINILIIVVLLLLIVIESILSLVKLSRIQYRFFPNRMQVIGPRPQYIDFSHVVSVTSKQNFFDKLFGTGTIILGTYRMKSITNLAPNLDYIQKLVQSSRAQYVPR